VVVVTLVVRGRVGWTGRVASREAAAR
jgi:hypothetical protein